MRRAREDDYEAPVDGAFDDDPEARENDAHVSTYMAKRPRTGLMQPLVFVLFKYNHGTKTVDNYTFSSQDVVKRHNILHAVRGLASMNDNGPSMVGWLLEWVTNPIIDAQMIPSLYRQRVVEVYMKLNPQDGEWNTPFTESDEVYAPPDTTITYIGGTVDAADRESNAY